MKPQTATQLRDREIKLIHVARRDLGLDDATYRAVLREVAGVKSSTELDSRGRHKLLEHFKQKGFTVKSKAKATKPNVSAGAVSSAAADPQYHKIRSLWSALHEAGAVRVNTEAALRIFIKRITGCDDYRFCNGQQVVTVIEALKKWLARSQNKTSPSAAVQDQTPEEIHV